MNHPNILRIEGAAPDLFPCCMVSRWMENGNLLEYLRQPSGPIDRLDLVRADSDRDSVCILTFADRDHHQLLGIIRGLNYLHRHRVIHGDLKGVRTVPSPNDTQSDSDRSGLTLGWCFPVQHSHQRVWNPLSRGFRSLLDCRGHILCQRFKRRERRFGPVVRAGAGGSNYGPKRKMGISHYTVRHILSCYGRHRGNQLSSRAPLSSSHEDHPLFEGVYSEDAIPRRH